MADNSVFIAGAAPGALAEALDGMPPWATEETAVKIQGILNKTLSLQTKAFSEMVKRMSAGGMSPEEVKKLNDEFEDLVKNTAAENKQYPKRRQWWKDEETEAQRSKRRWREAKEQHSGLMTSLGVLSGWGTAVLGTLTGNITTFDNLYASGVNLMSGMDGAANGFESLQQIATLTGVRYTELAKTLEKYSTAVNTYGMGKFVKTLTTSSASLAEFGFSTKESADLLGAYLESQRGFSDVNSRTQEQVQKDLVKFGERVTKLSLATGTARNKLLENIEAISESVEANILAGRIGTEAAASTQEFIASFKDKNLGNAFLRMMTDAIKPLNDTFMDFQKTGFGGFGQKLMAFTQSLEGLEPEEAARRTAEFAKANDGQLKMMVQRGNLLRRAGVKEADGMLKIVTGLQQQGRSYKEVSAEEMAAMKRTAEASKQIANAWEKLLSQLQATFVATPGILENVTWLLTKLNDGLSWLRTFEMSKVITPLVAVGLAIFGVVAKFTFLGKAIDFMARKMFDLAMGKPGGGGRGGTTGRQGGGGRGGTTGRQGGGGRGRIGKMGGGGSAVSSFFESMGSPKALLGVASIGIAAAGLFVLGKALQEFASVDFKSLAVAGTALIGLGAIAAGFGAGAVVIATGAAVLVGVSASLWVFSKAMGGVAEALSLFSSSFGSAASGISLLSDAVSSFTGLGKLKDIVSTINDINLTKAVAFGVLSKLNPASLPAPSSSVGVATPGSPQSSSIRGPSSSVTPAAIAATAVATNNGNQMTESKVNSLLVRQNAILEQLLLSTNSLVSTNQDILKYTRVRS